MNQSQLQTPGANEIIFLAQSPMEPSYSPIPPPPAVQLSPTSASAFTEQTPYSPAYGNTTKAPVVTAVSSPAPPTPSTNPFSAFMKGPSTVMSPDAMLRAYATRVREGSASPVPGTPMETAFPRSLSRTPSTPSLKGSTKISYPAFDAPATPEPIHEVADHSVVPGPPPMMIGIGAGAGRTLYQPGQGQAQYHGQGRVVSQYGNDDAYGGYGTGL